MTTPTPTPPGVVPPAEPEQQQQQGSGDVISVLVRAARHTRLNACRMVYGEAACKADMDLLLHVADLVQAYRKASKEVDRTAQRDAASVREAARALNALLLCLRGAPTPPNDDKGGAGPRMGESKEVGNPQGSVVHLASPSSPNDDKGGTTDGE